MKVRATATGLWGDQLRYDGDEFDVPDGMKAKWWEPVTDPEPAADAEPEKVQDKPARKKRAKKKS